MKKLTITICSLLLLVCASLAQESIYHLTFEEEVNPSALRRTGDMHPTTDGGYIFTGTWGDNIYSRAFIVKTDADRNPEWSYRLDHRLVSNIGQVFWKTSYGADILELEDGSYLWLAGVNMRMEFNQPVGENLDYAIIHFSPGDGMEEAVIHQTKRFGAGKFDIPQRIQPTPDGGYILSGISSLTVDANLPGSMVTYLVKLDENLDLQWNKRIKGPGGTCNTSALVLYNEGMVQRDVAPTSDGGFVFSLGCDEFTYYGKLDAAGELLWTKRFQSTDGFFDGTIIDPWGIMLVAGGYGAMSGIMELPGGDLAFLGNQVFVFLLLFGEPPEPNGGSLSLPLSYLFITDGDGNFKKGTGFFTDHFAVENMPIHMLAEDFLHVEDDRFVIACGTDFNSWDNTFHYMPALLELDASATELNTAMEGMHKISSVSDSDNIGRYDVNTYPYGLDGIHLETEANSGSYFLNYDNSFVEITDLAALPGMTECFEQVPPSQLYSFPFDLTVWDTQVLLDTLNVYSFEPYAMSAKTVDSPEHCTEEVVTSSKELNDKSAPSAKLLTLTDQEGFLLAVDTEWLGAEVTLVNALGQSVQGFRLVDLQQHIYTNSLPTGLYLVHLEKQDSHVALKAIVAEPSN